MAMEQVPAPCGAPAAPNSLVAFEKLSWRLLSFDEQRLLDRFLRFSYICKPIILLPSDVHWHLYEGKVVLAKPSPNGGLHQDEWSSEDLKFTMTPSCNGGFDINIGSRTIRVPKFLSAQNPLVQMVLFAACHVCSSVFGESVKDVSMFRCPKAFVPQCVIDMINGSSSSGKGGQASGVSANRELGRQAGEDGATLDKGARGSVSYQGTDDRKVSNLSKKDNGAPGSEPDKTDWQLQQQQQDTLTGVNHVAGMYLLGLDAGLSDAFGGCFRACQGKMQTSPINLGENSTDSGSVICEIWCKITSGLAATEHLNEQHFLKDDAEHRQQRGNGVWANSTTQQKRADHHGEQYDHSGAYVIPDKHGISISLKKTDRATAWLIASAVSHHATGNRDLLSGFAPVQGDLFVKTADAVAAPMRIAGTGNVVTDAVVLPDVWYVPGLAANVVSVSQLAELDYSVAFGGGQCYVRSAAAEDGGVVVGAARAGEDGVFALDFIRVPLGL